MRGYHLVYTVAMATICSPQRPAEPNEMAQHGAQILHCQHTGPILHRPCTHCSNNLAADRANFVQVSTIDIFENACQKILAIRPFR